MRYIKLLSIIGLLLAIVLPIQPLAAQSSEEPDWIRTVAWSPDGKQIATASLSGAIEIWDAENTTLLYTLLSVGEYTAIDVEWHPDGTYIAGTSFLEGKSYSDILYIWDASTQELVMEIPTNNRGSFISWSPDGAYIARTTYAPSTLTIWDALTGMLVMEMNPTSEMYEAAWNNDSQTLFTTAVHGIQIWELGNPNPINTVGDLDDQLALSLSPDNQLFVVSNSKWIEVWVTDTLEILQILKAHSDYIYSLDWNPDGTKIGSTGSDGNIHVWDIETGIILQTFHVKPERAFSVSWNPDGKRIVYGGETIPIIQLVK